MSRSRLPDEGSLVRPSLADQVRGTMFDRPRPQRGHRVTSTTRAQAGRTLEQRDSQKARAFALIRHAGDAGISCKEISRETGIPEKSLTWAISGLVAAGVAHYHHTAPTAGSRVLVRDGARLLFTTPDPFPPSAP